jgi:hypothetical protein
MVTHGAALGRGMDSTGAAASAPPFAAGPTGSRQRPDERSRPGHPNRSAGSLAWTPSATTSVDTTRPTKHEQESEPIATLPGLANARPNMTRKLRAAELVIGSPVPQAAGDEYQVGPTLNSMRPILQPHRPMTMECRGAVDASAETSTVASATPAMSHALLHRCPSLGTGTGRVGVRVRPHTTSPSASRSRHVPTLSVRQAFAAAVSRTAAPSAGPYPSHTSSRSAARRGHGARSASPRSAERPTRNISRRGGPGTGRSECQPPTPVRTTPGRAPTDRRRAAQSEARSADLAPLTAPGASELFLPRCIFAPLLRGGNQDAHPVRLCARASARYLTAPPVSHQPFGQRADALIAKPSRQRPAN